MPPASPLPPVTTNNFDTPEYDALQQQKYHAAGEQQAERVARECFEDILLQSNLGIHEHRAHTRTLVDAVDSCLATCLEVIEMQYPAREDHPVSVLSLEHSSWEPEKPPDPCSLDSWLRSALPESASLAASISKAGESWVMQQFLSKQPSMHRSASMRSPSCSNTGAPAVSSAAAAAAFGDADGAPETGSTAATSASQQQRPPRSAGTSSVVGYAPGSTAVSSRSLHPAASASSRRHVTKLETRKVLTPEQEQLEEQLRQELQQRKTQEEMSRRLEQRDAEERSKLASLRKELKGKDYTYDHKGEVVILNEFDPERTPLEALSGPVFKVAGPEEAVRTASPKRRNAAHSGSTRSAVGGGAPAAAAGGPAGSPAAGAGPAAPDGGGAAAAAATAAAGGGSAAAAAAAARGTLSPTEMRKERDRRLANDFKKITPRTQPSALETLLPAGGVTLRGAGGATKTGPLRAPPAGLTREGYAKQVAKKALQAAQHSDVMAATGGAAGGGTAGGGGGFGSISPLGVTLPAASMQQHQQLSNRGPAAAGRPPLLDPLAAYGDNRYDPFAGARARQLSAGRSGMDAAATGPGSGSGAAGPGAGTDSLPPASPDINLSLTSAGDWGAAGNGRSFEAPMALPHSKPTERQLVETVGRADRLPRERAALPTLAPPLVPTKAAAGARTRSTDRLQFHSVLAE